MTMSTDRAAKLAAGMSTGAAIAALWALLKTGKVQAAGGIPDELMALIIAMAQNLENIDTDLDDVEAAIKDLALQGGLGWPANTNSITALRVAINPAAGMQLPAIIVPSGMTLVLKAWALNPAWVQVGATIGEAASINQSFPLLPNEIVGYQVQNADQIYVATAGAVAGCFICLTVEYRKGGG